MKANDIEVLTAAEPPVAAVIVAAGFSRRMGAFKLTLPWHETTVIGQVAAMLARIPLRETVVVTGHRREEVENALSHTSCRCVFNAHYSTGEMLSSIQTGIAATEAGVDAILVCLGDQPQMEEATLWAVLEEGRRTGWQRVIIPSFQMRAGHPILLPRSLWWQILNTTENLRTVLRANADQVAYLNVDTHTILADLDTPEDYERADRGTGGVTPGSPERS